MSSPTLIHVGQNPPPFENFADYLDGKSARIQRAKLTMSEPASGPVLVISPPESKALEWPLADIRLIPDQAGRDTMIVSCNGDPVSRLIVSDADAQSILQARCRDLRKRPAVKGKARLVAWTIAAFTSIALIIFALIPVMADQLAEYLPPSGEQALGDTTLEQVRIALSRSQVDSVRTCTNPTGVRALGKMQSRLEQDLNLPYSLKVHVLDHDLINAFALPGGHVVMFRGLLEAAEHPDEIAAVFAHEIGHVVNRDPTRGALRSAGSIGVLGLVFGDFAGGAAVLFMVERLIDATYSREAEAAADDFAHATLAGAGVSPSALAVFFERLRLENGDADGLVAHFLSHPSLGDRAETARQAGQNMTGPIRPSLGEEDWQDLRNICG